MKGFERRESDMWIDVHSKYPIITAEVKRNLHIDLGTMSQFDWRLRTLHRYGKKPYQLLLNIQGKISMSSDAQAFLKENHDQYGIDAVSIFTPFPALSAMVKFLCSAMHIDSYPHRLFDDQESALAFLMDRRVKNLQGDWPDRSLLSKFIELHVN